MIWAQLAWAALLSFILATAFRSAWRWEHGKEPDRVFSEKNGRETYVLVPPTVLFWILIVFAIVSIWIRGISDGLTFSAMLSADVMLLLSIYFVLLLILLPLLRRWFSARACAILWLVPTFLMWQFHILIRTLPAPWKTIYVPRSLLPTLGTIWLVGFIAVGGYYLIAHLIFSKQVREHTSEETDEEILSLWESIKEEILYRRPVKLMRGDVNSPFSMGRTKWNRATVLPNKDYTRNELAMIFSHELHHLQRCDVNTKVFLCLCNALCWFNPLVWIATRKAAEDLERSCDEIVTENMDDEKRMAYANLLLESAAPSRGCTTCLSAAAGTLRYRLKGIMDRRKRFLGTALVTVAVFGCVLFYGRISVSDLRGNFESLILPADVEIERIYYDSELRAINDWDDAALRTLLNDMEVDHILGVRNVRSWGFNFSEQVSFDLSDGSFVEINEDGLLYVSRYDEEEIRALSGCYAIKDGLDWAALMECFTIDH